MKQRYYSLNKIKKEKAQYNLLLGERANGKSYSVKELVLTSAFNSNEEFIYLRRFELELKPNLIESYFSDSPVSAITNGEYNCVSVYRKNIYFANVDDNGKITRGKRIGYAIHLSGAEHYKSTQYPKVTNLIFEEFITESMYLQNEVVVLMNLVSTVFRNRTGQCWLVGNTISRLCPYFSEWELRGIPKQKQGTIDIYNHNTLDGNVIKIAVEYCESANNKNTMFFGRAEKQIVTGAWECSEHPHLNKPLDNYDILYKVPYHYTDFKFMLNVLRDKQSKDMLLYIYPYTKDLDRFKHYVSNSFSENNLVTENLCQDIKGDKVCLYLLNRNKVVFSDNLTGSDFYQIIKQKGGA